MRQTTEAWRSRQSRERAERLRGPLALPAPKPEPSTDITVSTKSLAEMDGTWDSIPAPAPPPPPTRPSMLVTKALPDTEGPLGMWPWQGVKWSVLFAGFLVYLFIITTYRFGGAPMAMGVALLGIGLQRERFRLPPAVGLLGVFVLWSMIGYLQTDYPDVVWDRVIDEWKLFLIVVVAANALRSRARVRFYTVFFLGCYALFPVRGAFVNFAGGYSAFGRALWNHIYANPNDLAALTLLQLSMAAGLIASERRGPVKWAAIAGVAVLPTLILFTQSRGAMIALFLFVAAMVVLQKRRFRMIVIVGVLAIIGAVAAPRSVWERVRGLRNVTNTERLGDVDREGSAVQRYEIWKVARKISREHPMMGVGLGVYPIAHRIYALGEEFNPTARGPRDTHSMYLNVLAETGYPGLALFLAILLVTVVRAERVRRKYKEQLPEQAQQLLFLELGLLAFCIDGVFGSFGHLTFTYLHLVLIWASAEMLEKEGLAPRLAATMALALGRRRLVAVGPSARVARRGAPANRPAAEEPTTAV